MRNLQAWTLMKSEGFFSVGLAGIFGRSWRMALKTGYRRRWTFLRCLWSHGPRNEVLPNVGCRLSMPTARHIFPFRCTLHCFGVTCYNFPCLLQVETSLPWWIFSCLSAERSSSRSVVSSDGRIAKMLLSSSLEKLESWEWSLVDQPSGVGEYK